jgi:hypothetical protein
MALDLSGLAAYLAEHHHHDLLRVETFDHYTAASDGTEFARYRAGEPEPDRASKAAWLDRLRADTASGRPWRRLRVITPPLTDYVRYSCEWGYTDNTAAGEQVRVLDLAAAPPGSDVLLRLGDFYLLDHAHAAAMRYDPAGRFLSADPVPDPLTGIYRSAASAGWGLGEPFERWWGRHPEHRRTPAAG